MSDNETVSSSAPRASHRPTAADRVAARRGRAARNFAIALGAAVAFVGVITLAGYGAVLMRWVEGLAGFLFHPLAMVFLVALGLEYVILKSADRTRLLQMELDKLRAKRRGEVARLRTTREGLEKLRRRANLPDVTCQDLASDIDVLVDNLRPPEARLLGGADAEPPEPIS